MTVPNFMSKAFSYQDLRSYLGNMCTPRGMIRQKYPRTDRVKGAVNRHFVNYFSFTLIHCADNSLHELGLSRLFILVSYYGHNCNYF